jgi:hypothetical protein
MSPHPKEVAVSTAQAFRQAVTKDFAAVASDLQEILGQRLVAYVAGVGSPKSVGRWATGVTAPQRDDAKQRVRNLYRVVCALSATLKGDGALSDEGVRAWLLSANPELNDRIPLDLLRDGEFPPVGHAADNFINNVGTW